MKSVFYAAWSLNPDDVLKSSSGGIWYLLGKYFVKNSNYICGAAFDNFFSSLRHILSNNMADLEKIRGSKYATSALGLNLFFSISEKLQTTKILFSGCPCQIGALEFYLKNKNSNIDNLYTCSLVCYGNIPFKRLRCYLDNIETKFGSKVTNINFRSKKHSPTQSILIEFQNGNIIDEEFAKNNFVKMFFSNQYIRNCCYNCKFKSPNSLTGDIGIGDFWGVQQEYPRFYNPSGTSLLIINTEKGNELISLVRNEIFIEEVDPYKAIRHNPKINKSLERR